MSDQIKQWANLKKHLEQNWLSGTKDDWEAKREWSSNFLTNFQNQAEPKLANEAWFIVTLCDVHLLLLDVWDNNSQQNFTEAWCTLEQAEILSYSLHRNLILHELETLAGSLLERIKNWQKLYPYNVFASPEFLSLIHI